MGTKWESTKPEERYFRDKKIRGLIFTLHNTDENLPYQCMQDSMTPKPIDSPEGPSWWSRLSGRYRTAQEQREFRKRGCVDVKLPPLEGEDAPQK